VASGPADGAEPTVIVDDLHVVYRVYGAGGDKGTAATALMRVIKRQRRPSVREVHAIRGISFVINHGDAVGIIGRNGSGKSTLLQAIAGLLPPEQGCVYSSGQAALLGVNAALLDDLTGERNVVLGCLAMGMTPQETKDRYQSIVDFSGVGNFIDYPMRTYSTGMAQRLRFSIASAKNHEILMIDEALATGDANFRAKSHERIVELRGEAGTVFLVAHNLAEIEASCNRVIWLEKGKIMRQGYDVPGIIDAYLEATGAIKYSLVEDRLVAVLGLSAPQSMGRDDYRLRGWVGPTEKIYGRECDKGHFIAHSLGGAVDRLELNVFVQRRDLNRGWSAQGRQYRAMEKYCVSKPGTLCFSRPLYEDQTSRPTLLEFGLLKETGDLCVEVFDNRDSNANSLGSAFFNPSEQEFKTK